jgi:hypothetical protein
METDGDVAQQSGLDALKPPLDQAASLLQVPV